MWHLKLKVFVLYLTQIHVIQVNLPNYQLSSFQRHILKSFFCIQEEYIRQLEDEYNYEEVPVENYYENGATIVLIN